jgi:hypothetical protein
MAPRVTKYSPHLKRVANVASLFQRATPTPRRAEQCWAARLWASHFIGFRIECLLRRVAFVAAAGSLTICCTSWASVARALLLKVLVPVMDPGAWICPRQTAAFLAAADGSRGERREYS